MIIKFKNIIMLYFIIGLIISLIMSALTEGGFTFGEHCQVILLWPLWVGMAIVYVLCLLAL